MIKDDTWTIRHDLALIYIALAYGTDRDLAEEEIESIISTLIEWGKESISREDAQEIVIEAMAIYMQDDSNVEVTRTIRSLRNSLSEDERKSALQSVVKIAEADGVVLSSESSMIAQLAELWGIKSAGKELLDQTSATVADVPSWSLLHDMALVCVVLAHSTDNDLSPAEIDAILDRMHSWQPDLDKAVIEGVMREAITYYASEPDQASLSASVKSIRDALPPIQRLAFIDDLAHIARSDGHVNEHEKAMVDMLAEAWGVDVRFKEDAS